MNGSHDNYLFTQLDSDPTNLPDGTIEGADCATRPGCASGARSS